MGTAKTFVCAGEYKQFLRWCADHHENHQSQEFVVVTTPSTISRLQGHVWTDESRVVILRPDYKTGVAFEDAILDMKMKAID